MTDRDVEPEGIKPDVPFHLERAEDLAFARSVLSAIERNLSGHGLPRARSIVRDPQHFELRTRHSRETIESLAASTTGEVSEGLDLAEQVLGGLASNLSDYGNARVNLRMLGVHDTVRSTEFVDRLHQAIGAVTGFIEEPGVSSPSQSF